MTTFFTLELLLSLTVQDVPVKSLGLTMFFRQPRFRSNLKVTRSWTQGQPMAAYAPLLLLHNNVVNVAAVVGIIIMAPRLNGALKTPSVVPR
jgi:hypothetical protein